MLQRILSILIIVHVGTFVVGASTIDEARAMYHDGRYESVVELLASVVKKTPKDGNVTFFLGASLYELGKKDEAEAYLTVAQGRNVLEASRLLAIISLDNYDPESAQKHLDKWEEALKKQKKSLPDEINVLGSRVIQMRNMLERVEKIEIIDSLVVDKDSFFNAYKLSSPAGRILPSDAVRSLGAGAGLSELSLAYMPENRSELLWAAADDDGVFGLYSADILDDGTIDNSVRLDNKLGDGGDAKYPFLMPDGMTLYFANNGDNTLGGYDIFMTRRTDNGGSGKEYYQPQNIGMPYNSPYDDYLLAIDEISGLGWWATDRNQIPGKVTIYIFAPSSMRVNVSPSDPNLRALAALSDLNLTRKEGTDYKAMLKSRLPVSDSADNAGTISPGFMLDMGNGKIYTKLSDFHNDRARMAMLEVLAAEASLRKHLEKEDMLREQYRKGDKSLAGLILDSESQTDNMRKQISSQRNAAIRLETK